MWTMYRFARSAGYSVIRSLGFAFLNWDLPDRSADIKRQLEETRARIRALEGDR
jgi:hypothetical protein